MFKYVALCVSLLTPLAAYAASDNQSAVNEELRTIHAQIQQLQQRVQQPAPAASTANAFNPAISLILSGSYGSMEQNPATPASGFATSTNDSGHSRGFSLQESELGISANIDPQFRGVATVSLAPEGSSSVENAFVETTTLGHGLNLKMGRFFSGLGYLNDQHSHVWDFVDQPLVYRSFWDNQLADDGLQFKWLAPSDTFIELGGEVGRGRNFPGSNRADNNGAGAETLFAHIGDDFGISSSWRTGFSLHQTKQVDAVSNNVPDALGNKFSDSFTGDSRTAGMDFVWKYAPNGNPTVTNFKFQAEYFQRKNEGTLTYNSTVSDSYSVTQSGWYAQGIYQFMPFWRAGVRYDQLDSGTAQLGAALTGKVISDYGYTPTRSTVMLDYSPSEFSRLRLQYALDESRQGLPDHQIFMQYIMSLGAHGAHQF
jgi:hypothetical protein